MKFFANCKSDRSFILKVYYQLCDKIFLVFLKKNMLTNCEQCKFFHMTGCAVNPIYWQAWNILNQEVSSGGIKQAVDVIAQSCADFDNGLEPNYMPSKICLKRVEIPGSYLVFD